MAENIVAIRTEVTSGQFVHNLAEVKASVKTAIMRYQGITYTDDNIREAIEDKNTLSRLMNAAEEQRKALTAQYEQPLKRFKAEYDEVLGIIKEAYNGIKAQIDDYDARQAEEKHQQVLQIIEASFPETMTAEQVQFLRDCLEVNPKWWTNKTSDLKKVDREIRDQHSEHFKALNAITLSAGGENDAIVPQLIDMYIRTKDLAKVLMERENIVKRTAEAKLLAMRQAERSGYMATEETTTPEVPEAQSAASQPTTEWKPVTWAVAFRIRTTDPAVIAKLAAFLKGLENTSIETIERPHEVNA